jgi:hypothetical protein
VKLLPPPGRIHLLSPGDLLLLLLEPNLLEFALLPNYTRPLNILLRGNYSLAFTCCISLLLSPGTLLPLLYPSLLLKVTCLLATLCLKKILSIVPSLEKLVQRLSNIKDNNQESHRRSSIFPMLRLMRLVCYWCCVVAVGLCYCRFTHRILAFS